MAYPIQSIPDREILVDGKPHLYFGGTAYLGLQNYAPFKELYLSNVSKYGMHYDSIPAEMTRGSVLLWHGSLWHGGGENRTPERRIAARDSGRRSEIALRCGTNRLERA